MTKLEPTEAQRELMIQAILGNSGFGPKSAARIVDAQIDAANSIPEGAPVGTIARRPDGKYLATRILTVSDGTPAWNYKNLTWPEVEWEYLRQNDADSWPVIYDPTRRELRDLWNRGKATEADREADLTAQPYDPDEYHEGDKPRLERLMREPSVFEAHLAKLEVIEVLDALGRLDGTVRSAVKLLTGFSDERLEELGGFADPTAQQEPALRERFPEQASAYVADPELAGVDDEPLPSGSLITPKPRTPRVVDRLGVEEQGSQWRDRDGDMWSFRDGSWRWAPHVWTPSDPNLMQGNFTEVLGDPS
ncbi:hypothetical protein HBE99_04360 [Mycobacteroides chelonae]|uniref:hypothetical protein n=1 Tax=Mycobacteroides chelonae TaxID=1774 RepID=UPI00190FC511|nr:hypothetical protein [Mycobacteroides chelonae]QQG96182.1 hypothetical protein HBE99_04360 [Mycobacteroides chelonae]